MNLFYLKLDLKMILKNLYHFNKAQWLTRNIRKPGAVGNLKFSIYAQNCNGLTSWSFEIPASAYCHRCGQFADKETSYETRNKETNSSILVPWTMDCDDDFLVGNKFFRNWSMDSLQRSGRRGYFVDSHDCETKLF